MLSLGSVTPEPFCIIDCEEDPGVLLSLRKVQALADNYPPENSGPPEAPTHWYEYVAVIACDGNTVDDPNRVMCPEVFEFCERFEPGSTGPQSRIYHRIVDESGATGGWVLEGATCFTRQVPERSGQPAEGVTIEMIIEQFNLTPFSIPTLAMQPPDDRTLVTLPVYFQAAFPDEGYEPGEIETVEMLGDEVRIRPTLQNFTYDFGDGTTLTDTLSLGGPYPTGDVTNTYDTAGSYTASLTVTFGGEYSINGEPWQTIPADQTLDAGTRELQVFTSRNHLTGND